ncbi:MAG: hypothetical protein WBA86_11505 [Nodosilinea sp.]
MRVDFGDEAEEIIAELIKGWPNLATTKLELTSKHTRTYNCFAYAAGDDRWWSPKPMPGYYWPPGVPREVTIASCIAAYETLGFRLCDNGELEDGYEKIALYALASGVPTHAALQLDSGDWSSKLGHLEDISHELFGLQGEEYGEVVKFMKRFRLER